MRRFKKVILTLLAPLLLLGVSVSTDRWLEENDKLKVLSTTAQIDDLVTSIGGDRVDSRVLIRGDLDPHSYEMVKGDGEKLAGADLIFYNGLGLEHGANLHVYLRGSLHALAVGEKIRDTHSYQILKK